MSLFSKRNWRSAMGVVVAGSVLLLAASAKAWEATYTVHSCTCRGDWNCGPEKSGQVASTPGERFPRFTTEEASKEACRSDLFAQVENVCNGYGALQLTPVFTCSSEQVTTPPPPAPQLPAGSYAVRDGLIWGPMAKDDRGNTLMMNHQAAIDYCHRIRQRLPTGAEFQTLRTELGHPGNYNPRGALSDLRRNWFWGAAHPNYPNYAYYFGGSKGGLSYNTHNTSDRLSVRCVSRQ